MGLESSSDADLARRCRRGEPDAWRELVRRFTPLVYRLSVRMLREGSEAEDVSQEVFLRMHRSLEGYDPTRPLAPWVSRMAYNACLRRLQTTARRGAQLARDPSLADEVDPAAPSPEAAAAASEAAVLLAQAVGELPAQDRALLDLRYREGLSDAELSEATGMPVNTVKTRLFRARARLREWLGPRLTKGEA